MKIFLLTAINILQNAFIQSRDFMHILWSKLNVQQIIRSGKDDFRTTEGFSEIVSLWQR